MAMIKTRKQKAALLALAVVLALATGCGVYVGDYYRAEEGAVAHSETVTVEITDDRAVFMP